MPPGKSFRIVGDAHGGRAVETRTAGVDPPPRPLAARPTRPESRARRASRDRMLRRGCLSLTG